MNSARCGAACSQSVSVVVAMLFVMRTLAVAPAPRSARDAAATAGHTKASASRRAREERIAPSAAREQTVVAAAPAKQIYERLRCGREFGKCQADVHPPAPRPPPAHRSRRRRLATGTRGARHGATPRT